MKRLLIIAGLLNSCTHTVEAERPFVNFPARFYSEQRLSVITPGSERQLKAQLRREADRYDLVLVEPRLGLVLARAVLDDKGTRTEYLAPQIDAKSLPLQEIGSVIRQLYSAPSFLREGAAYVFRPEGSPYSYRLEGISGSADCAYPQLIRLQFKQESYRLDITVESFSCS